MEFLNMQVPGAAGGGGSGAGSVTSAELVAGLDAVSAQAASALSQRASVLSQAISAVSAAVASETSNRISADGVLSLAINVVSNAVSNEISNRLSAHNVLSQAISVVSAAVASEISNRISADNAVSAQAASAISQLQSLLSQRISALSINALKDVSISSPVSGNVIKYVSATGEWTNQPDATGGAGGSGSNSVTSAVSLRIDSVGSTASHALSIANAVSIALLSEISNRISADNVLSGRIDSVAAAGGAPVIRIVSNTQSTTASALTDVSGMVLTVAANETWHIQGMILLSTSAATAGVRLGFSVPPLSTPRYARFMGGSTGQSVGGAFFGGAGNLQVSGSSILLSNASTTPAGGLRMIEFMALFNVASAGTVRLMFAGVASTTASPHHLLAGTFMKCFRIK